jgi:heptosyltransferase-1
VRVLIVKVSSLGDIIHTLPAVTDAKQAHPNLVFDWVVEENFTEVPGWHPAVDRVIPVAIRRWRKSLMKTYLTHEFRTFKRALQGTRYDLVIDAQGLIKSGIISRMSRGLTIGLSNRTVREPLAALFYNKAYSVPWTEHAVDRVRQLFSRALQYQYDPHSISYGLDTNKLKTLTEDVPPKTVVFLHGTTWSTKHWPMYFWRELAFLATKSGFQVLLPWGNSAEKERAEYISDGNEMAKVLERQSLSGVAQHINDSKGVIAVDTGLGHLAAALEKPTVSLYGPTDSALSGTFGLNQIHLVSNLDCAPCVKKTCSYNGPEIKDFYNGNEILVSPPCFSTNKPDYVWERFCGLFQK